MDKHSTTLKAENTFGEFIQTLSSIGDTEYNMIPFAESWTAGQLAEHVSLSASGFIEILNGPVKDVKRNPEQHVHQLTTLFLDFNTKMESPDFVLPEQKEYDKQEHTNKMEDIKVDFLKAIQVCDLTKLCAAFELPVLGYLTGAEAVTFVIVHTQRHLHQLRNIAKALSSKEGIE